MPQHSGACAQNTIPHLRWHQHTVVHSTSDLEYFWNAIMSYDAVCRDTWTKVKQNLRRAQIQSWCLLPSQRRADLHHCEDCLSVYVVWIAKTRSVRSDLRKHINKWGAKWKYKQKMISSHSQIAASHIFLSSDFSQTVRTFFPQTRDEMFFCLQLFSATKLCVARFRCSENYFVCLCCEFSIRWNLVANSMWFEMDSTDWFERICSRIEIGQEGMKRYQHRQLALAFGKRIALRQSLSFGRFLWPLFLFRFRTFVMRAPSLLCPESAVSACLLGI